MRSALRSLLFMLLLASTLSFAVATASANSLDVSDETFKIVWDDFDVMAGTTVACDVTLSGSFHETGFEKVADALIGHVTHASAGTCGGGATMTMLDETLPWRVSYREFSGELPQIQSLTFQILDMELFVDPIGIAEQECLFETSAREPLEGRAVLERGGAVTGGLSLNSTISIDLYDEFLCQVGTDAELAGTGAVTDGEGGGLSFILGEADPLRGILTPSPERVTVTESEESDAFTIRNTGDFTATVDNTELTGVDTERPEFEVSSPGCSATIAASESCTYAITVAERPLRGAGVAITYDDGLTERERTVTIPVEIQGTDKEAELRGDPTSVTIDALEQNDILEIRNNGLGLTATIDRVTATTSDAERPDFTVTTTGCRERLPDDQACHYVIGVNARPETSGSIVVEYDDGRGVVRRATIEVDIVGPTPAELEADPTEVNIESLELNDTFVIRNIGAETTAAIINRSILTSDDRERPEFSVTGIGCTEIHLDGTSCIYVVSVNSRPEADGRYAIEYDDGAGNDRTVTINVDIAS